MKVKKMVRQCYIITFSLQANEDLEGFSHKKNKHYQ